MTVTRVPNSVARATMRENRRLRSRLVVRSSRPPVIGVMFLLLMAFAAGYLAGHVPLR